MRTDLRLTGLVAIVRTPSFHRAAASVRIVPSAPAVYAEKVGGRIRATGYGKMRLRELMVDLYFDRLSQKD